MQARLAARFGSLALVVCAAACDKQNLGIPPPDSELFFPNGLMLDPRPRPADAPAKYLWAVNGNNDLSFAAGTVVAIDLERFWAAWYDPVLAGVDPWCNSERCVQPEGAPTGPNHPCRRIAELPAVVECDERHFIERSATVRVGDFPTLLSWSQEPRGSRSRAECDANFPEDPTAPDKEGCFVRLWVPVRGDPSITYIDLDPAAAWNQVPRPSCGEGTDPDELDSRRCAGDHVLTRERNDESLSQLEREPFNLVVSEPRTAGDPLHDRLLFVAHAGTATLTVVGLDGVLSDRSRPAILDQAPAFIASISGGFGLTTYPCNLATGAVPAITRGCTRPLVYGGLRYALRAISLTASGIDEADLAGTDASCADEIDEIGQPGKLVCDPIVRSQSDFPITGLDVFSQAVQARLGDIAFFPDQPDVLWAVQTNPGALVRIDTSLDERGEPRAFPSHAPIEICDEPTRMVLWQDGNDRHALVSCFRAAEVFVVDLVGHRVIKNPRVATGAHDLVIDAEREVVYLANTLEGSISVIDLARDRPTRFEEMARIGLRDPFER